MTGSQAYMIMLTDNHMNGGGHWTKFRVNGYLQVYQWLAMGDRKSWNVIYKYKHISGGFYPMDVELSSLSLNFMC